ncbi:hypothetical protein AALP_AA8G437300 [Arabis alpina]|uniref:Uncharacterized protein n=1 Tax=Arabis alpina TaxID=50452 RepID=A0A087GD92_ARAAL|nr:hypothetical protein AALP_AA8G437300 [Arabis alpina]
MTTETTTTSPAIPPPHEHHSDHQPLNSDPIFAPLSPPRLTVDDFLNSNGILTDQPINEIEEEPSHYKYLDTEEYADKYRRYESEFKQYLLAKYFSGVEIFEESTVIGGETIRSSKWPCTRCYADPDYSIADPLQCLDEQVEEEEEEEGEEDSVESASAEITPGEISNGGIVPEKNTS